MHLHMDGDAIAPRISAHISAHIHTFLHRNCSTLVYRHVNCSTLVCRHVFAHLSRHRSGQTHSLNSNTQRASRSSLRQVPVPHSSVDTMLPCRHAASISTHISAHAPTFLTADMPAHMSKDVCRLCYTCPFPSLHMGTADVSRKSHRHVYSDFYTLAQLPSRFSCNPTPLPSSLRPTSTHDNHMQPHT